MDSHLVTVKVGVERSTCKRVQLNSFSFNQFRLECLNTKSVQSRGTVKQNRMALHYVLQNIPYNRIFSVYHFLCALNCLYNASLQQFADNERFVKLCSNEFWKTAFMHLKFRTNNNN